MAPEPVLRPELSADGESARLPFLEKAGSAANGWLCVTSYADPSRMPAAEEFTADYAEKFSSAPGLGPASPFAVETYDALLLIAAALRPGADGGPERGSTTKRLRASRHDGLVKPLGFHPTTGRFDPSRSIFIHRVKKDTAVFLGRAGEVK